MTQKTTRDKMDAKTNLILFTAIISIFLMILSNPIINRSQFFKEFLQE